MLAFGKSVEVNLVLLQFISLILWPVCAGCNTKTATYRGIDYIVVRNCEKSYSAANEHCKSMAQDVVGKKGQLAILNSSDIISALPSQVRSGDTWFGLTDEEQEGTFLWIDGTTLGDFENWEGNTPSGSGNTGDQDCAMLKSGNSHGKWLIKKCDGNSLNYLCEIRSDTAEITTLITTFITAMTTTELHQTTEATTTMEDETTTEYPQTTEAGTTSTESPPTTEAGTGSRESPQTTEAGTTSTEFPQTTEAGPTTTESPQTSEEGTMMEDATSTEFPCITEVTTAVQEITSLFQILKGIKSKIYCLATCQQMGSCMSVMFDKESMRCHWYDGINLNATMNLYISTFEKFENKLKVGLWERTT